MTRVGLVTVGRDVILVAVKWHGNVMIAARVVLLL